MRAGDVDGSGVEIDDEDPAMRIGRLLNGLRHRRRIDAGRARRRLDDDVLEVVDFLRRAVFENLEVVGGQVLDRDAAFRGEGVHADQVRPAAESWWLL